MKINAKIKVYMTVYNLSWLFYVKLFNNHTKIKISINNQRI